MKIEQKKWKEESGWQSCGNQPSLENAHLVLAFGQRDVLSDPFCFQDLRKFYPKAHIVLGTTSGDILDTSIADDAIVATAISFQKTPVAVSRINIKEVQSSFEGGAQIAAKLPQGDLAHVFVISDGQLVNGSELVKGLSSKLPKEVQVTGGLAGDGTRFEKTLVGLNAPPKSGEIIGMGFYGKKIKVGFGSMGGWDPFGPERRVTKSSNNLLYELDGRSALELYKKYLGEQAKDLPSAGLLFPLSIKLSPEAPPLVRTILNVNEEDQSMTFAGDIPEGAYAQLMKANFDRLIDGASNAASRCHEMIGKAPPDLAILISCVGRRIVLGQRAEEELESVKEVLGDKTPMAGFYSYGEIAPTAKEASCELHNQTMTITTLSERD